MVDSVGNPKLEAEYMASGILKGMVLPSQYTDLCIQLAGIPMLQVSQTLEPFIMNLQDELIDNFGLVKEKESKDYLAGNNPGLFQLLTAIFQEVDHLIKIYGMAAKEKFEQTAEKIQQHAQSMDYFDLGQGVDQAAADSDYIHKLDADHTDLRKMQGSLAAILRYYGAETRKFTNKVHCKPGVDSEYKMYLQQLVENIDTVTNNVQLAFTLGSTLDSIIGLLPKDDLDPYISDVCANFIKVITNPKDFYNMCKQDDIVSSSVGQMFAHSYPQFYEKFLDMYMDEVPKMEYQEQIDFRKCFALPEDTSQLTALCSNYIKVGFKQQ